MTLRIDPRLAHEYLADPFAEPSAPLRALLDLMRDEYQFSVYIRAFSRIQTPGYKPKAASWQELGGIHGLPYSKWRYEDKLPAENGWLMPTIRSGDPAGPDIPDSVPSDAQWGGKSFAGDGYYSS